MRPANDVLKRLLARISLGPFLLLALSFSSVAETQKSVAQCQKPIYLTFDTGHMGVAPLIAEVLRKHRVPVTFFGANEKTQEGDGSLGLYWSAWWKERASEGHDFASHTFDHAYWRADIDSQNFKIRPSAGEQKDQNLLWRAEDYCANLKKASQRLEAMTGRACARRQNFPSLVKGSKSMWLLPCRLVASGFFGRRVV